jgi:hypothetical protein
VKDLIEANVYAAILEGEGSLRAAADVLQVSRLQVAQFIEGKPTLLQFVENCREEIADDSQIELGEAVDKGAPWSIRYTLKTAGAKRGYGIQTKVGDGEPKEPVAAADADSPRPVQDPRLAIPDSRIPVVVLRTGQNRP